MERRSTLHPAVRQARYGALAAIVAARRLELDLTQVEASELADVTPRTLRAVEKGQNVTLENLSAILAALGLHLEVHRGHAPAPVTPSASLGAQYELTDASRASEDAEDDQHDHEHENEQEGSRQ